MGGREQVDKLKEENHLTIDLKGIDLNIEKEISKMTQKCFSFMS